MTSITRIRRLFPILPDQPTLLGEWESLVATYQCRGKLAHDTRLVAAMHTHGLTELLTFNGSDFRRFPGITVLDPAVA
jgi:predicted nucleic acid-binding protein